jgi:ferrochelatase
MAVENRDNFLNAGGETYRYIPALNSNADHIQALADIIQKHTQGWAETSPHFHSPNLGAIQKRAKKLGAKH